MNNDRYISPWSQRYASPEMQSIFSPGNKYTTWRKLWLALAKAQKELGLPITAKQLQVMEKNIFNIDYQRAEELEAEIHHDVMAHIKAYAEICPLAAPIIHLGATSCYVTDNGDLIQMREGLKLLVKRLKESIKTLAAFAQKYAKTACLAYTHLQPAQPTTVGKRACLWLQDLLIDLKEISRRADELQFLGVKGATGTQASFLTLFDGDKRKIAKLEKLIASEFNFKKVFPIAGQTYTRKQDILVLSSLAGLGASIHKFGTDLRLLSHMGELHEGFSNKQIGSSAMPYKRNPILAERSCSLSRYLIALNENPLYTAATQWLERSLDDSANRRLAIPEAFLAADALLLLLNKIFSSLQVNEKVIEERLNLEKPRMVTENILMKAVTKGGNRQELHEKLRMMNIQNTQKLIQTIAKDKSFNLSEKEVETICKDPLIGIAPDQVKDFIMKELQLVLKTT